MSIENCRFLFQNEGFPGVSGGEFLNTNTEVFKDQYEKIPDDVRSDQVQSAQTLYFPDGETAQTLHYKLHGYEVQLNDSLIVILRDRFGLNDVFNMPVEYASSRLPKNQKPHTVLSTNFIYVGQKVFLRNGVVVIEDIEKNDDSVQASSDDTRKKRSAGLQSGAGIDDSDDTTETENENDTHDDSENSWENIRKFFMYEIVSGDTLGRILREQFGLSDIWNLPVDYRSSIVPPNGKPSVVREAGMIYPGQKVLFLDGVVIITDERDAIVQEKNAEHDRLIAQEEAFDDHCEAIEGLANNWSDVEKKFHEKNLHVPKKSLNFLEKNSIKISPQRVYIDDNGFAAFPSEVPIRGGGVAVITLFADQKGNMKLYDSNVDAGQSSQKGETIDEQYSLSLYNEIIDYEVRRNRAHNVGLEDIDEFLFDDDLAFLVKKIAEKANIQMIPFTKTSQAFFRRFVRLWIKKASRESYAGGGTKKVSKIMKEMISKGDYQSEVDPEKVRAFVEGELYGGQSTVYSLQLTDDS